MSTTTPTPPCSCSDCAGLRAAIEKLELPIALTHDDGQPVMVNAGGTEISAAEAWLRRLIASDDRNTDTARQLLADISGDRLGHRLDTTRLRKIQTLILDTAP